MACPFILWGRPLMCWDGPLPVVALREECLAACTKDRHKLCPPIAQLRFPDRLLRVKAESDSVAEKWEAELNRAHMLKVNGPPVIVSKGITLADSPSAKTAARQVRACPAMHRTFMRHAPGAMHASFITSLRSPLVPCIDAV